jgi:hypothetical protein
VYMSNQVLKKCNGDSKCNKKHIKSQENPNYFFYDFSNVVKAFILIKINVKEAYNARKTVIVPSNIYPCEEPFRINTIVIICQFDCLLQRILIASHLCNLSSG